MRLEILQAQKGGNAAPSTGLSVLYLLLAMPVSVFLYLKASPEAASFLAGYCNFLLDNSSWPLVLAPFFFGAVVVFHLPLPGRKWLALLTFVIPVVVLLL